MLFKLLLLLLPFTPSSAAAAVLKSYDWDNSLTTCNHHNKKSYITPTSEDPFLGIEFDSGYLSVGAEKGGEMFYWYFKETAKNLPNPIPLIIWLTGGPGCSSAMAALTENGPLTLNEDTKQLIHNPYGWTELGEVLYIDQPLGTGFSTIGDPRNIVRNEDQVAEDLREFFEKLIIKYPKIKGRPIYITGESYAGHYIPSISALLVNKPIIGFDFKGMAIGNGWVDPILQYPMYADYGRENGLIGNVAYRLLKKGFDLCIKLIEKNLWELAYVQCNALADGILGKRNPYDIRMECQVPPMCYNTTGLDAFLNDQEIQNRLHVKKQWNECSDIVYAAMLGDWCTDMSNKVAKILESGKQVLIYSGDKDYICNWRGGLEWTLNIPWSHKSDFAKAKYSIFNYNHKPRGELKTIKNLAFLRVYDAGHMVPMDQPESAFGMLQAWINKEIGPPNKVVQYWEEGGYADNDDDDQLITSANWLPADFKAETVHLVVA